MYNGIGLQTPRGSGTNGYIQTNKFFVKPRSGPGPTSKPPDLPDGSSAVRKPNKELLEHDRRRQVELRLLVLREKLEEQGYEEAEIEDKVSEARKSIEMEMEKEDKAGDPKPPPANKRFADTQSHQIAARKEKQMETLRAALGISLKESSDIEDKKNDAESDVESGEFTSEKDNIQLKDAKNSDGQLAITREDGGVSKKDDRESKKHGGRKNTETGEVSKLKGNVTNDRHVDYSDSGSQSDSDRPIMKYKESKSTVGKRHDPTDCSESDSDHGKKSGKEVCKDNTLSKRKRSGSETDRKVVAQRHGKRVKTGRRHDSSESESESDGNVKKFNTSRRALSEAVEKRGNAMESKGGRKLNDGNRERSKRHDSYGSSDDSRDKKGRDSEKKLLQTSERQRSHDSDDADRRTSAQMKRLTESRKLSEDRKNVESRKRIRHGSESSDSEDGWLDSSRDDRSEYSSSDSDDHFDSRDRRMAKDGNMDIKNAAARQSNKLPHRSHSKGRLDNRHGSERKSAVANYSSGSESSEYSDTATDSDDSLDSFDKRKTSRDAKVVKQVKTTKDKSTRGDRNTLRQNVGTSGDSRKDFNVSGNDRNVKDRSLMERGFVAERRAGDSIAKRKDVDGDCFDSNNARNARIRNYEQEGGDHRDLLEEGHREYKRARNDEPRYHSGGDRRDESRNHFERSRDDEPRLSRRERDDESQHHSARDRNDDHQHYSGRSRDDEPRIRSGKDRDDEPRSRSGRDRDEEPRSYPGRDRDRDEARSYFGRDRDDDPSSRLGRYRDRDRNEPPCSSRRDRDDEPSSRPGKDRGRDWDDERRR